MTKFIELLSTTNDVMYINPEHIVRIYDGEKHRTIDTTDGNVTLVRETVQEIKNRIKEL